MRASFAIPGDLTMLSGGYGYDRALLRDLPSCGIAVDHLRLPDGFPFPTPDALRQSIDQLQYAEADVVLIDGLAFGALQPQQLAQIRRPMVALVHHPLGLEAGLTPPQSAGLLANERAALVHASRIIVTSETTKQTLVDDFGVDATRTTVAVPGIARAARARGSGSSTVQILAVGAVIARKAYDVLVTSLATLTDHPWHLTIVGSLDRDLPLARALKARIADADLSERITFAGELDDTSLAAAYDRSDVFVLASHYEGYGMVLSEAMAHGLPIVTSTGGASGSTVPDEAALKVPPGDAAALSAALRRVIWDGHLRATLSDASHAAGRRLPTWMDTAQIVADVLRSAKGAST